MFKDNEKNNILIKKGLKISFAHIESISIPQEVSIERQVIPGTLLMCGIY